MLSIYYTHYINQTINFSHCHVTDDGQQMEQSKTTMKGKKEKNKLSTVFKKILPNDDFSNRNSPANLIKCV